MMKKLLSVLACVFLLSGTAYGGLVAHWSFNDEENVGFNEVTQVNDLTDYGGPEWEKGALKFDGVNDYLEAPIGPPVLLQYTVCFRFKSSVALKTDETYFITRGTDTQSDNFFLRWAGRGRMSGGHETTTGGDEVKVHTDSEPSSKLNNGKWHEVWLTYDGITLTIYRDGAKDAYKVVGPPPDVSDAPVRIGARNPAAEADNFKGYIDDIKIYDEALTPPTIELMSAYVDYGFGGNMNHFYPRDFMRFNVDYVIEGGDLEAEYKVVAVALNKYPPARNCPGKKKRSKGFDIVKRGAHTLRYSKLIPVCAEPPAIEWADCIDVKWTIKLTTKLTRGDRQVVLDRDNWLMDEALFIHSEDHVYKGY